MIRSKRTLADTDANIDAAPAAKRTYICKTRENNASAATQRPKKGALHKKAIPGSSNEIRASDKTDSSEDDKNWVYICNPQEETCGTTGGVCVCGEPVYKDDTASQYVVTKKGYELTTEWRLQKAKREQDAFGMYIFRDWNGYGICEVMENMV